MNPGKPIEDKKQISFADHDARIMGKNGDFDYRDNGPVSVDEDHQIIVGQHVSQNANDKKEVSPALDEIRNNAGRLPDLMSLDNGFFSGENLETWKESEVDAYVACGKESHQDSSGPDQSRRQIKKTDFVYNEASDCFICPQGHLLQLRSNGKDGTRIYQASAEVCRGCLYQNRCCRSQKGTARTIVLEDKEPLRQAVFEKMRLPSAARIYRKRKTIVEPVIGQIKNTGFRKFNVRGSPRIAGEFSLVCIAHNFSKIVRSIFRGIVCLESGKLVPVIA